MVGPVSSGVRQIVKKFLTFSGLMFVLAGRSAAAESAAGSISFTKEVAPILVAKCLACHNAEKAKGSYRLHTFDALLRPGSTEEVPVVSGKAAESKLYQLLVAADEEDRMPQKDDALPPNQIALVKEWIEQGAKFDGRDRSVPLSVLSPPRHPAAPRSYPVAVPITALSFDASGDRLAAGGYHEITLWNSHSGKVVQRIGEVAERTFDVAFSPDGRWLACASGTPGKIGEVKLFNATNGQLAKTLSTTADAALCLSFSADSKKLAAGGADNAIRLWEIESSKPPLTIEQHADWVLALAFSPDGSRLASGSRDKSARIFVTATGELDETYTGHTEFVTAVAWADSKSVLSASSARNVHRWNMENAKKVSELSGWPAEITRLIVAGTNLFSASQDRRIRHHTLKTNELVRTFDGHRDAVYSLALHQPSQRIASGSHDGEVRIWNIEDGALLLKFIAAPGYTPKLSRSE